jgi:hypothetical protein
MPLHFFACLKPGPVFPPSYIAVFFVFNDLRWDEVACFVDIGGIIHKVCVCVFFFIVIGNQPQKHYVPNKGVFCFCIWRVYFYNGCKVMTIPHLDLGPLIWSRWAKKKKNSIITIFFWTNTLIVLAIKLLTYITYSLK